MQPFAFAARCLEAAAKDVSEHGMLLGAGAVDALEYACVHDFSFLGASFASNAAGAQQRRYI